MYFFNFKAHRRETVSVALCESQSWFRNLGYAYLISSNWASSWLA